MTKMLDDKAASIESLLLDYTRRLARYAGGRRAIIIHLSKLRPDNRRAHHIRIAANAFETLVKQFDGQIFLLQNADIVFICKDVGISALDEAVTRLRYLFGDDPLALELDDQGPGRFATWYDLNRDHPAFLAAIEQLHDVEKRRRKRLAALQGGATSGGRLPLDPQSLAQLVASIERADLSNVLRRQPICAILPDEPPSPIFREIYISIPDLRDAILPGCELDADRWLFQYLTQELDKRVLALLRKNDDRSIAHSYSLNLNLATLLAPEFLAFDQHLPAGARGSIVIELQKADIFADIGAFLFARDFAKERGYRLCLDAVSGPALAFIDREQLDLDLVKLFWHPDLADTQHSAGVAAFRDGLDRIGKKRVILARCDSEEAVQFGLSLGLRLFQGRHIDRLVSAGTVAASRKLYAPRLTATR
jgi:hypothetical protein